MQNSVWQLIDSEYKEYPEDYGGPLGDLSFISDVEKELKVQFSEQYKFFVQKYGSGIFPGHIIYGLRPLDDMDDLKSVLDKTNFYKNTQQWPGIEDWYIVSDDGRGNPIGCKPDGSVWLSDHDSNFEQVKLANDFEEFLHKLLTDTLYE